MVPRCPIGIEGIFVSAVGKAAGWPAPPRKALRHTGEVLDKQILKLNYVLWQWDPQSVSLSSAGLWFWYVLKCERHWPTRVTIALTKVPLVSTPLFQHGTALKGCPHEAVTEAACIARQPDFSLGPMAFASLLLRLFVLHTDLHFPFGLLRNWAASSWHRLSRECRH